MLKILIKKQMTEIFRKFFYNAKKNRAYSKSASVAFIVLFILLMGGVIGGFCVFLSFMLCRPMHAAGMDWLYFALMGLISILLGAFGSVFNTFSTLYLAKDNDLLLSMPIPVSVLMASRLMSVYLMGLIYSGAVILPAVIVYWCMISASLPAVICGILFVLLISIFVLTISCALGWVVAKCSTKLKHKSITTVLVSLLLIAVYYFIYFKAQTLIRDLIANADTYGNTIKSHAYPLYLFGAAATGKAVSLLIVAAVILGLFALIWFLISKSFLKIATSSGQSVHKTYREKTVAQKSISAALFGKELQRFFASPAYMLNCGLGCILLPVAGIAFLWKNGQISVILGEMFGGNTGAVAVLLMAVLCLLISMNVMTAPSVSLEGKGIWLAQSLPVTGWQVLRAKIMLPVVLTGIPTLFCIFCLTVSGLIESVQTIMAIVFSGSFLFLFCMFGLFLGLKMPNLTWTNEITPIKQGAAVVITLFAGWGYTVVYVMAFFVINSIGAVGFYAYTGIFTAITVIFCVVFHVWLKRKGSHLFMAL